MVLNCPGASANRGAGLPGRPRNELPGVSSLLPAGLRKEAAGALAHAAGGIALAGSKGTFKVAAGINAFVLPAVAPGKGVTSDGSLGRGKVTYSGGIYTIPASVGTQVGGNLFESFGQFDLLQNEIADFQGPGSVEDIIARVTGGISSIDGGIESDIKGANLFLINSAGVMFGAGARLKVGGAFTVSTADSVELADGGKFNASLGGDDVLTTAVVSGFGFAGAAPAAVSFSGSVLVVPVGTGLNVIAGDVTLNSATLAAPSGGLTVFSAASAGEVPFSIREPGAGYGRAAFSVLGALSLSNGSTIAIDGAGGGTISIRAGAVTIDDSMISSINSGPAAGGDISVVANGTISITETGGIVTETELSAHDGAAGNVVVTTEGKVNLDAGEIASSTLGLGHGGDVRVTAREITDSGAGGIFSDSQSPEAAGAAGNVTVDVAGSLNLVAGGEISSSTTGLGRGGDIAVTAGTITISGIAPVTLAPSGIVAISDSSGEGGDAGKVVVNVAGLLRLAGIGDINSSTYGSGNGGDVTVTAREISITGASGIFAVSNSFGAGGHAGDVTVRSGGSLELEGNGDISSSTLGLGHGGTVHISAHEITVSGGSVSAESYSSTEGGAAGDVTVSAADTLNLEEGGEISSSTFGLGDGGDVTVTAREIAITGASGIFADSISLGAGGAAGDVTIRAGSLNLEGGGDISSSTSGLGNGGNVTVTAQEISISGATQDGLIMSEIIANSESPTQGGDAGDVMITAGNDLNLTEGGEVETSAVAGNAGEVAIHVGADMTMTGGSTISSSAGINGGNIDLNVGGILYLLDSSITATAGTLRNINRGTNDHAGNGGNITLDPEFIVLEDSLISANAAAGQGGNIIIASSYYLNSGSTITATGVTSGSITITSPELDLSGALVGLPASPVGAGTQLQETCAMAINGDFSSFLAVGQGDIEAGPDEAQGKAGGDKRTPRKPARRGRP